MVQLAPGRLLTLRMQWCKNLKHSFGCVSATGEGGVDAAVAAAVASLEIADFAGSHINGHFVRQFNECVPQLRELSVEHCPIIEDVRVTHTGLKVLRARGCPRLLSVQLLCPALQTLDLSRTKLSNDSLVTLLRDNACTALQVLRLSGWCRCGR